MDEIPQSRIAFDHLAGLLRLAASTEPLGLQLGNLMTVLQHHCEEVVKEYDELQALRRRWEEDVGRVGRERRIEDALTRLQTTVNGIVPAGENVGAELRGISGRIDALKASIEGVAVQALPGSVDEAPVALHDGSSSARNATVLESRRLRLENAQLRLDMTRRDEERGALVQSLEARDQELERLRAANSELQKLCDSKQSQLRKAQETQSRLLREASAMEQMVEQRVSSLRDHLVRAHFSHEEVDEELDYARQTIPRLKNETRP